MAREHCAIFTETSAKDGNNVIDALVQLARYRIFLYVIGIKHVFRYRDMCSSEDVEVQTSALKIRDEERKKNCCK